MLLEASWIILYHFIHNRLSYETKKSLNSSFFPAKNLRLEQVGSTPIMPPCSPHRDQKTKKMAEKFLPLCIGDL